MINKHNRIKWYTIKHLSTEGATYYHDARKRKPSLEGSRQDPCGTSRTMYIRANFMPDRFLRRFFMIATSYRKMDFFFSFKAQYFVANPQNVVRNR